MSTNDAGRRPGRPRDEAVGAAILAAARELVARHGYDAVTTRMIAEAAGAGKQTLYRRWPGKAELVLEAFLEHAAAEVDAPAAAHDGPVGADLAGFLGRTFAALDRTGPAVRSLMATAQGDPAFRRRFRERLIEPRRRALRGLLAAAVGRGELPADADLEAAILGLYGAMWYGLLLDEPLDDALAARLARLALDGLGRGSTAGR